MTTKFSKIYRHHNAKPKQDFANDPEVQKEWLAYKALLTIPQYRVSGRIGKLIPPSPFAQKNIEILEQILFAEDGMQGVMKGLSLLPEHINASEPSQPQSIEEETKKRLSDFKNTLERDILRPLIAYSYVNTDIDDPKRKLWHAVANELGRQWTKCRGPQCDRKKIPGLRSRNILANCLASSLWCFLDHAYEKNTAKAVRRWSSLNEEATRDILLDHITGTFHGALAKYSPSEGNFISFALTFVQPNVLADHVGRRKKPPKFIQLSSIKLNKDESMGFDAQGEHSPAYLAEGRELLNKTNQLIDQMQRSPNSFHRQYGDTLKYLSLHKTPQEIAQINNTTVEKAENLCSRARKYLKQMMARTQEQETGFER